MSLELRIRDRLLRLYPDHDCFSIMDSCLEAVGPPLTDSSETKWSERDALLICYPDQLTEDGSSPLSTLKSALGEIDDGFSIVHVLPFFPSSSDGGFAIIDHLEVAENLGNWSQISSISSNMRVMADLVLNHVSWSHRWVKQFVDDVEPGRSCIRTILPDEDLSNVARPRTSELSVPCETAGGSQELWCTFGHDQVDVDWRTPEVLYETLRVIDRLIAEGIRWIRLDAVAYVYKKSGTSCVHLEETHELVKLLRDFLSLRCPQAVLITETNVPHSENLSYLRDHEQAHVAYNFSLAPLLAFAFLFGSSTKLVTWLKEAEQPPPGTTLLNFLASHDGIGLRPVEGLLTDADLSKFIEQVETAGGTWSGRSVGEITKPYEINVALPSLLGQERLLTAHTLLASIRGLPAFYFPAIEGEPNDLKSMAILGENRGINRPKKTVLNRQAALSQESRSNRDELVRRLNVRRQLPAFHPEAQQFMIDLDSPLIGFTRGTGSNAITVIANLGFDEVSYEVSKQSFDVLSGQTLGGQIYVRPAEILWLSTIDNKSAQRPGASL